MSFRVVNQGRVRCRIMKGAAFYMESDTTEITPDWRPEDWAQIKFDLCRDEGCAVTTGEEKAEYLCPGCEMPHARIADKVLSACLEALGRVK